MQEPSLSHSRPRFGCLAGTFNPSHRQIRSTRLCVHQPPGIAQQRRDLAIAVAAVLPRQLDDVARQRLFVVQAPRRLALRRAMLTERRTDAALGDSQMPSHMLDTDAPARGAYQFRWRGPSVPEAASFKISLSSVRSAIALRSRRFSVSSSLRRFT